MICVFNSNSYQSLDKKDERESAESCKKEPDSPRSDLVSGIGSDSGSGSSFDYDHLPSVEALSEAKLEYGSEMPTSTSLCPELSNLSILLQELQDSHAADPGEEWHEDDTKLNLDLENVAPLKECVEDIPSQGLPDQRESHPRSARRAQVHPVPGTPNETSKRQDVANRLCGWSVRECPHRQFVSPKQIVFLAKEDAIRHAKAVCGGLAYTLDPKDFENMFDCTVKSSINNVRENFTKDPSAHPPKLPANNSVQVQCCTKEANILDLHFTNPKLSKKSREKLRRLNRNTHKHARDKSQSANHYQDEDEESTLLTLELNELLSDITKTLEDDPEEDDFGHLHTMLSKKLFLETDKNRISSKILSQNIPGERVHKTESHVRDKPLTDKHKEFKNARMELINEFPIVPQPRSSFGVFPKPCPASKKPICQTTQPSGKQEPKSTLLSTEVSLSNTHKRKRQRSRSLNSKGKLVGGTKRLKLPIKHLRREEIAIPDEVESPQEPLRSGAVSPSDDLLLMVAPCDFEEEVSFYRQAVESGDNLINHSQIK